MNQVTNQDISYLRAVLVDGFSTGQLPRDSTIFHVVASVLKLSPQEMENLKVRRRGWMGRAVRAARALLREVSALRK